MEDVNPVKETFLNVGLPTFDVYSDIGLTYKLYTSPVTDWTRHQNGTWTETTIGIGHPIFASSLLIPFLINYTLGWRAWYYGDVKKHDNSQRKKITWIFALLGCYPQLVSSRTIYLFWKQPQKAMKDKKHLERNVMENEVFTEAVPTTLIMAILMMVLVFTGTPDEVLVGEDVVHLVDAGAILFFVTFATSALSAGLGLAKCLKVSTVSAQPLNMQTMLTRTFQFYIKHIIIVRNVLKSKTVINGKFV